MSETHNSPRWLRPTVEYGPIIVFIIAYKGWDLFVATGAIMVAALVALLTSYLVERRLPVMPLITAIIIGIFGGLTLWLQDETFIKMKPTIIEFLFGSILLTGRIFNKLFLKNLMGSVWHMQEGGWRKLTLRFGLFFYAMATLNEIVWRTQSTDFWVNFKVFGLTGLTMGFVMFQLPLLKRFALEEDEGPTTY